MRELIVHAVRYVYPAELGAPARGLATAHAGPTLAAKVRSDHPYVWPFDGGTDFGPSVEPLHPCVPGVAARCAPFYELMALIDVMRFKRPANVGWLLAHGADVHAADPSGRTALHHAVRAGVRPDVIARLLAHGADPERADADGENARAAAQRLGRRWPG